MVTVAPWLPACNVAVAPVAVTETLDESLDVHVIVLPVSAFPFASLNCAVSVPLWRLPSVNVDGVTRTWATGGGAGCCTVMVDVPVFPSLVAVMVAVPGPTPVTTPLLDTVATVVELDDHATVRPESVAPLASRTVADSVTLPATARVAVAGDTATDATGTGVGDVTTICALPVFPSDVAVTVVVPAPVAVTSPCALTVATELLAEVQVTVRPLRTFPFASVVVAFSAADWPVTSAAEAGLTATAATGTTDTVTVAVAVFPSLVPEIVVVPAAIALTVPEESTVATCGELLAHTTWRPVRVFPPASYATSESVAFPPTGRLAADGAIATDATETGTTCSGTTADCPLELAAICTVPTFFPVTTPAEDTTAIVVSELDQNTVAPATSRPSTS